MRQFHLQVQPLHQERQVVEIEHVRVIRPHGELELEEILRHDDLPFVVASVDPGHLRIDLKRVEVCGA